MQNTIKKDEPEMSIMNGKIVEDPLTPADYKLIKYYKDLEYGELKIIIRKGVPIKIDHAFKSIRLVDPRFDNIS